MTDSVLIQPGASPINGTFRMTQTGGLITYDPDLLASPKAFIATMVHELSHYAILTQPARAEWETEPMLEELVTDLFVIASGFGIFKIESITNASAFQSPLAQGWSISHAGYISPELAAVALAFYLRLNDQDPDLAKPHLSGLNQKRLTRALHQLDRDAELLEAASPR
ncbi:hypothetical protein K3X41_01050 [Aliiroseovarius crassostreae]|uniref:hypothetical protein n=1 Tax=Aliiroseovarius crassostreae TaxID=154981 RepID=UPI00220ACDF5|nr:hypothetical protein [Aliiroseovarius crassostreae]UWQ08217.1 hypothetical protein K3X25_01040 [Aliiroseovarius crassostreae]UWQ11322.1 hypothetical protein K3X41_01050 [Aliiroseovarius crassostreae]